MLKPLYRNLLAVDIVIFLKSELVMSNKEIAFQEIQTADLLYLKTRVIKDKPVRYVKQSD